MLSTSARLLRLLTLLQTRRRWTGPDLAAQLEVTARTVRNDIERLRSLGYPVHAAPGLGGGYQLGAGATLPPLALDNDEAVAIAVGLRTASGVAGIEDAAARALAKLEQVLPARARHQVATLQDVTTAIPRSGPTVAADVLANLAVAIRARAQVRFDYTSFDGAQTRRTVEPYRLVFTQGRWFLVAWDIARNAWRTFRADRLRPRTTGGRQFLPRPEPDDDLVAYVSRSLGTAMWQFRATARVRASAVELAARVPAAVVIEALDEQWCLAHVGAESPAMLALWLGMLDADFTIVQCPAELTRELDKLARRYSRAARG
jgi:predicted DNA-binding transcriptional regulator YafY